MYTGMVPQSVWVLLHAATSRKAAPQNQSATVVFCQQTKLQSPFFVVVVFFVFFSCFSKSGNMEYMKHLDTIKLALYTAVNIHTPIRHVIRVTQPWLLRENDQLLCKASLIRSQLLITFHSYGLTIAHTYCFNLEVNMLTQIAGILLQ